MRVWSATTLPSAAVLWQAASGAWSLTTVAKATFQLDPGEAPLAAVQQPVFERDFYEAGGILRGPSDLAPFKVRPDVIVVGCAFAPRPVTSLVARVAVGGVDKMIEVHGARWLDEAGQLVEGPPFSTMPLGWQAAAGGPDTTNPAGMSLDQADRQGRVALPHQVPPGARPPGRGEYVEPVAFAPVPPGWPQRAHLAGAAGPAAVGGPWFDAPLPADVHPAFFNVAPADQQPDFLAEDPRILLENLSPKASRLTTTLAPVRAFTFVEGGRAAGRYAMRADTVFIDTDHQICCVTYRATIPLVELDASAMATILSDPPAPLTEPTAVLVHGAESDLEHSEDTHSGADDEDHAPSRQSTSTHLVATDGLPFAPSGPVAASPGWPERESPPPASPALPFHRKPAHTRPIDSLVQSGATPFEARAGLGRALTPPPGLGPPGGVVPPAASGLGPPALPGSALAPPLGPPPPRAPAHARRDAGPKTVPPPMPAPPLAPPLAMTPPHARNGDGPAPVVPAPSPSQGGAPPPAAWSFQQPVAPPRKILHEARAALDGVAGVSNAAADRNDHAGARALPTSRERPRVTSNDVVDLVWFADDLPARARRQAGWLDAIRDERKSDDWVTVQETNEQPQQDKDRRHVMRALARVHPTEASTFNRLLAESVDEEGFVDRPLLVVAGDLVMQFDPIETLKASVELASQLASSEKLKEALDAAKEIAQAQRVSTPAVESLLSRIRTAFAQANRNLANDYLESTVQRTMLEERRYLKRQVLGGPHLVAQLPATGGGPTTTVYLPEHLGAQLPVVPRLRTRLIVEPHPQQHPSDGEGVALRTLALGRVIGSRGKGAY